MLALPIPPIGLSPNGRLNWKSKSKLTKSAKNRAYMETKAALQGQAAPAVGSYSLSYFWPGPRRDDDNAIASAKAYLDGICLALGIDDRTLRFARIEHGPAQKKPRLEIRFFP